MKTMTCKQLGGACDLKFSAATFDEMAALSQNHGKEMFQLGDQPHLEAMSAMMALMQSPDSMQAWMSARQREFEALPEEN